MYHLQAKLEQMKGVPRTRKRSHDVSASEEELEIDLRAEIEKEVIAAHEQYTYVDEVEKK